jgi:hypothetical protein
MAHMPLPCQALAKLNQQIITQYKPVSANVKNAMLPVSAKSAKEMMLML